MEMIDRYIYAVTKNLPESEREDVERELRANIEDMLGQNYSKDNIKTVLEELGDPEELADEYRGAKRYLIGPKYYVTYITVLKLVISIVAAVIGAVTLFSVLIKQPEPGQLINYIIASFTSVLQVVISGVAGAAIWVTVIFAVIEKSNAKIMRKDTPWSIDKLPQKPTKTTKISRGGVIVSLIFYVLWIGVVILSPNIIGIYEAGYGMTPLFDTVVLSHYLPLILALSAFGMFVAVIKLIYGRWNGKIAVLNLIMNLLNVFTVVILLRNELLFNPAFIERIQLIFNLQQSAVDFSKNIFVWFIIIMSIIGTIADSIGGFVKAFKNRV